MNPQKIKLRVPTEESALTVDANSLRLQQHKLGIKADMVELLAEAAKGFGHASELADYIEGELVELLTFYASDFRLRRLTE